MKPLVQLLGVIWMLLGVCFGQITITEIPTLEIHQIDVGDGDATFIKVNTPDRIYAILIDAGKKGYCSDVRQYIWGPKNHFMDSTDAYLDLIITSHYDDDHIGGFGGTTNRYGVLDGYEWKPGNTYPDGDPVPPDDPQIGQVHNMVIRRYAVFDPGSNPGPKPAKGSIGGTLISQEYARLAGDRRVSLGDLGSGVDYLTIPERDITGQYPAVADAKIKIGGTINLGFDRNHVPIRMSLIASNGYVLSPLPNDHFYVTDVAAANGISRNPGTSKDNNNWCLAWVLEYGEFRYFTGGDLPGYKTGKLFDVETTVAQQLPNILVSNPNYAGHICALKANHHGSDNSSNEDFVKALKPHMVGFSCGSGHDFPHTQTVDNFKSGFWPNPYLFNTQVSCYALTQMYQGKSIPNDRIYVSGAKHYVSAKDVPREFESPLGKRKREEVLDKSATFDYRVPVEFNFNPNRTSAPSPKKVTNGITVLYKFSNSSGLNQNDGNFILKIYPVNTSGVSIASMSSYRLQRKSPLTGDWMEPEEFNCHQSTPISPTTTSK